MKADVAIVAAGSTSWELAALGIPALLTTVAENQLQIASELELAGAAIQLGPAEELMKTSILRSVSELLEDRAMLDSMSHNAKSLVDGKGATRVFAEMLTLNQRS